MSPEMFPDADAPVTGRDLKELALRTHDLAMLATAACYDLRHRAERARSTSELERLFFRLAHELSPDLFIEAGAKSAVTSRRARRHLKDARIVAFEANPYTHARFAADNAEPEHRVEYLHLALSNEEGSATFNVRRREDGAAQADGQGSLLTRSDHEPGYEAVTVAATTLDTFFADEFESCAMWIDVEGASAQVLGGASAVLRKAALGFIEVEDHPFWGDQWLAKEVAACLYDAGLVAIARDYQSRHQYNVLFVRAELLEAESVRLALAAYRSAIAHPEPGRAQSADSQRAPAPVVQLGGSPIELMRRRATKLRQEPQRFFADSQNPFVRRLGTMLWG